MTLQDDKPVLSMVVTGRNDDYMGNFKYRLTSCLNFMARGLTEVGLLDEVELLVTDWGSQIPLSAVIPLTPEAARITRFLHVPMEVAGEGFFVTRAVNVSLRRGRGRYLMIFDADSLVPSLAMRNLLDCLSGRVASPFAPDGTFMVVKRVHVPFETVCGEPSLAQWNEYLSRAAGCLPPEQGLSGLGGSAAGQLAHRDIWYEVGAFNEGLKVSGWADAELTLRVTQRYPWIDLSCIGVTGFHQEHWPSNKKRGAWVGGVNPRTVPLDPHANDDRWGLADAPIDEQRGRSDLPDLGKTIAAWNVPAPAEAAREMCGTAVRRHVAWHAQLPVQTAREWEALCALAWVSLQTPPHTFLEYGMEISCGAAVVAAANPGLDLYVIDAWQRRCPEDVLKLLREVGYQGYTRLVPGAPATAFTRLTSSTPPSLTFDLALVRTEMLGPDASDTLDAIVSRLSPRSGLVVSAPDAAGLAALWDGLRARHPHLGFVTGRGGRTGLALAGGPVDAPAAVIDFGRPRGRSPLRRLLLLGRTVYQRLMGR